MSIPDAYRATFQTMLQAADAGDLVLAECTEQATGRPAYVVCMVNRPDGVDYELVPVARLFDANPYEVLDPPATSTTSEDE